MSDNIELEEAEPVDGSFLCVSLAEEVNSNSQENYCCGVCNHETVKFWQIGYRLFHGKFLRFMSGIRNFGQV
jgi:hypothetical protein